MIIFADGSYYEATVSCESKGSQEHFNFVTTRKVPFQKGFKTCVTIKYGRSVVSASFLREICGRSDEFTPRVFVDGYEKSGSFNNRF